MISLTKYNSSTIKIRGRFTDSYYADKITGFETFVRDVESDELDITDFNDTWVNYNIPININTVGDQYFKIQSIGDWTNYSGDGQFNRDCRMFLMQRIPKNSLVQTFYLNCGETNNPSVARVIFWECDECILTKYIQFDIDIGTANSAAKDNILISSDKEMMVSVELVSQTTASNYTIRACYQNHCMSMISYDKNATTYNMETMSYSDQYPADRILNFNQPAIQVSYIACYDSNNKERTNNIIVDKNGNGDYKTISAAVFASNLYDNIFVNPGGYEESVRAMGRMVNIIGTSPEQCILIKHNCDYRNPPLEINVGSVENMTIIVDDEGYNPSTPFTPDQEYLSYSIHIDHDHRASGHNMVVRNCVLKNMYRPCIGCGLQQDNHIYIIDCEMHSGVHHPQRNKRGALYFHTRNEPNSTNQYIHIINNKIICEDDIAVIIMPLQNPTGEVEFINNTIYSYINGKSDNIVWEGNTDIYGANVFSNNFKLTETSNGNTISCLNSN